jgi:hypothetical protein
MIKLKNHPQDNPYRESIVEMVGPAPPIDMEFSAIDRVAAAFSRCGLSIGRCFGSKFAYRAANPGHCFIPNANVFCRRQGKVWWGDLDLARDKPKLNAAARRLRARLYILAEHDGRFEKASLEHSKVVERAIWHTGGPMRIPGLRLIARRVGMKPFEMAILLGISERKLFGRHEPEAAAKILRFLDELGGWIVLCLPQTWKGKWGRWLATPNTVLGGQTPLEKLKADRELSFGKILNAEFPP